MKPAHPYEYVYIEVQGGHDSRFHLQNRLYGRYRSPGASMAVLADDSANWKPQGFNYSLFGCEVGIHFPVLKLMDYLDQVDALCRNPNPFALATAAQLLRPLYNTTGRMGGTT